MNIMENIWSILARHVYAGGRQYDNIDELVKAIELAWEKIDQRTIQRLYDGLQRRMMAMYDARQIYFILIFKCLMYSFVIDLNKSASIVISSFFTTFHNY